MRFILLIQDRFMRIFYKVLSSLIILTFVSCSCNSSTVAQYKYGKITRGQVKERAKDVKLNPQLERTIIESLTVEGIALHDALAAGYDKNETFMLRFERESWPVLKRTVNDMKMKSLKITREYVKCRYIAFRGGMAASGKDDALSKAKNTITLLGKGAEFDSLIKSYSSNPKTAVAESTLYIVRGGGNPVFEDTVFSLKEGTYTPEPLVLPDGSAVVLISDDKGTLTRDNLEKKVTSPGERKRLSAMFENDAYKEILTEMERNNAASFKVQSLPEKDDAVLFTVSGKDYTLKDLKKRRDLFSTIIMEPLEDKNFLYGFAKEWYYHELYKSDAEKSGYVNDKKYIADMKNAFNFILANDYIRFLCEKEVTVTEKDMLDEYSKNKNKYMKAPASGSKKMTQMSFGEAKVFVKKNLVQARVAVKVTEWKKRALAESGLVVK